MDNWRFKLSPRGVLPFLLVTLGVQCGGSEGTPNKPVPATRHVEFDVTLPACALVSLEDLSITTGVGVYAPGSKSGDVPNVDRPTLVLATRASTGDVQVPMLAGFAYPGENRVDLDARSTAVASALTHPVLFGTPGDYRVRLARNVETSAGLAQERIESSLCESLAPAASPIFQPGLRATFDELLYAAMSAQSSTGQAAAGLSECSDPSGQTPAGDWCTQTGGLAFTNIKSVFFGARMTRDGNTVIDLVEAKRGFIDWSVDLGKLFSGGDVLTVEDRRTTLLGAPDLNTRVDLEKGFLSSSCDISKLDDFVSGCLLNVGGDARAVGTWANLGQTVTLALDVVGVIDKYVDAKVVKSTLQPLSSVSKRVETFLKPLAQDPCLAFALEQTVNGIATILLQMADAETEPHRRDGLKTAAAFAAASSQVVLELAKLMSGDASGTAPSACGQLVNQISGRLALQDAAIHGRLSQAVSSGDWGRIARAIVAEAPRDVLNELPQATADAALTGLSLYRVGADLASGDAGLVVNDLLLAFYENPDAMKDVAALIAGAAIDAAVKNIAGFLLSRLVPWVAGPLAIADVINKGLPFVVDYFGADRVSFCYGSSCSTQPPDGGVDGGDGGDAGACTSGPTDGACAPNGACCGAPSACANDCCSGAAIKGVCCADIGQACSNQNECCVIDQSTTCQAGKCCNASVGICNVDSDCCSGSCNILYYKCN